MDVRRQTQSGGPVDGSSEFETFLEENPQVQYLDCVFADLCGAVRGKRIARAELESIFETGLKIPTTIYFLDARGDMVDLLPRGMAVAGAEGTAWPVADTLTRVNWSQRPHGQVLMTLCDAKGEPYFGEPRNVLARVVARFAELDLDPVVGCGLQFHILGRERAKGGGIPEPPPGPESAKQAPSVYGISDVDRHDAILSGIVEAAAIQGLPSLRAVAQAEPGHFRVDLEPTSDVMRAGDHAVFLRQIVRAVARKHGLDATFMAKPYLARAGSALHVNVSLKHGASAKPRDSLRAGLAGLQAVMAESIALFAPNANSYRRFVKGSAARNKRWGAANRTTGLAMPAGEHRIEHRVAGADANPYLVLAAVLAGVHRGIAEGLDPGQPFEGDATAFVDQTMPFSIDAALVTLENGSIMREYLDPAYVDLYCATKRAELDRFRDHIAAHEYDWYL